MQPTDDFQALVSKILETSSAIDVNNLALSNAPRGGENLVSGISGTLESLGIKHGDLLFASYTPVAEPSAAVAAAANPPQNGATESAASSFVGEAISNKKKEGKRPWEAVQEDKVDEYWEKQDGKIPRPKGKDGCRCGPKSMCDYCMPLEPFDATYQSSHGIKHLSYHAHLRKLNASAPLSSQAATWIPPLSEPSYKVQVPCPSGSHPSWPAGICTKCQPSAITLTRQSYRMVDHVEFAQPTLIEGLLSFWRSTGTQRFGFLLGRYEPYPDVPMGIKAVVEAIHELPQEGHADGVTVGVPWADEARVRRLATTCGLQIVGMIYTDLVADTSDDTKRAQGKVIPKRHANSFFLSSLEVVFSATLQRQYPCPSRFSDSGKFSSRFVTCVVSGDVDGNIGVEAYQVSDQSMSMVDADMIEASVEPGTMRVKEEDATRYIPDVFYRYKNKYNIDVKESAKPCFPVEYLLVNVTHGFPNSPNPLFVSPRPFAIENRPGLQDQSIGAIASSFKQASGSLSREILSGAGQDPSNVKGKGKEDDATDLAKVVAWLSDWHLLAYLDEMGIFDPTDLALMARIAVNKDLSDLHDLFNSSSWQTFLTIMEEQAPAVPARDYPSANAGSNGDQPTHFDDGFEIPPDVDVPPEAVDADMRQGDGAAEAAAAASGEIACPHCTFLNDAALTECSLCGLPLRP
ncbi:nuclear protein localization protein 4 [Microbotryomycetes sp. JL201]|nr:nuclear protein localization protein 4 [Microbotryomycetes sp. JL201]